MRSYRPACDYSGHGSSGRSGVKPMGAHKGRRGECGTRQAEIYMLAVAYSHISNQDFRASSRQDRVSLPFSRTISFALETPDFHTAKILFAETVAWIRMTAYAIQTMALDLERVLNKSRIGGGSLRCSSSKVGPADALPPLATLFFVHNRSWAQFSSTCSELSACRGKIMMLTSNTCRVSFFISSLF